MEKLFDVVLLVWVLPATVTMQPSGTLNDAFSEVISVSNGKVYLRSGVSSDPNSMSWNNELLLDL